VKIQGDKTGIAEDAVSVLIPKAQLFIPLAELVDIQAEIARLQAGGRSAFPASSSAAGTC
jgi:valyl-tRNA synthetase